MTWFVSLPRYKSIEFHAWLDSIFFQFRSSYSIYSPSVCMTSSSTCTTASSPPPPFR